MANKKPTKKEIRQRELRREAQKQIRRIRQFVRRAEKRGYTFPSNIVPTLPKTVTEKTIERLDKMRPEQLYKKAVYTSPEGTKVKGTKRAAQERSEAAVKAAETRKARTRAGYYEQRPDLTPDPPAEPGAPAAGTPQEDRLTIENLKASLESWDIRTTWSTELQQYKQSDKSRLQNLFNKALAENGEARVAQNIRDNNDELQEIVQNVLFSSGSVYHDIGREGINKDLARFFAILMGRPLNQQESMELTEFGEEVEQ